MNQRVVQDAIAALQALGEKRKDAERLIHDALNAGAEASSVDALIRAAYAKPSKSAAKATAQVQSGRFAGSYYQYTSGIGGSAAANSQDQGDLLQVAKAVGPGMTMDEFSRLGEEVEKLQARRAELTNAQYQGLLWALPDKFRADRNSAHFSPMRDPSGRPVDQNLPLPPPASESGPVVAPVVQMPTPSQPQQTQPPGAAPAAPQSPSEILPTQQTIENIVNHVEAPAQQGRQGVSLDQAQAVADVVGVVDQTGITDLGNAAVSLGRAFTEPERAGEHLSNAAMRAISAVPIVGDVAKFGIKGRQAAHHTMRGGKAAGRGASVDAAAQAALQLVGGGGTGDGGSVQTSVAGSSGGGSRLPTDDMNDAANAVDNFGGSIEKFLNQFGAAGAVVATVGGAIYSRALAPLIDWLKNVDDASRGILDSNRHLAQFNGQVGAAFRNLEADRYGRSIVEADYNANALGGLARSQSEYEKAQQDLFGPYRRMNIELQAMRTELASTLLKMLNSLDFIGNTLDAIHQDNRNNEPRNDAEKALEMLNGNMADDKVRPAPVPNKPGALPAFGRAIRPAVIPGVGQVGNIVAIGESIRKAF